MHDPKIADGVRPIRVRSVLMYTIKILQRLIDRGTHNSIFAFVLLILKTISREPHLGQKNRAAIAQPRASRLEPEKQHPAFSPRPSPQPASRDAGRASDRKRKTSRNQTIKEHGARTVRTHFSHCFPSRFRRHFHRTFVRLQQPRIREGR